MHVYVYIQHNRSHVYTHLQWVLSRAAPQTWNETTFFFKGHLVASYSLLAQEQTDTFVKAEYVLLIISLSLTPDISAGHEVGQRLYLFPSSETITFLLHFFNVVACPYNHIDVFFITNELVIIKLCKSSSWMFVAPHIKHDILFCFWFFSSSLSVTIKLSSE